MATTSSPKDTAPAVQSNPLLDALAKLGDDSAALADKYSEKPKKEPFPNPAVHDSLSPQEFVAYSDAAKEKYAISANEMLGAGLGGTIAAASTVFAGGTVGTWVGKKAGDLFPDNPKLSVACAVAGGVVGSVVGGIGALSHFVGSMQRWGKDMGKMDAYKADRDYLLTRLDAENPSTHITAAQLAPDRVAHASVAAGKSAR